jgi:hypothetical protein
MAFWCVRLHWGLWRARHRYLVRRLSGFEQLSITLYIRRLSWDRWLRFLNYLYTNEQAVSVPEGIQEGDAEYDKRNAERRSGSPVMRPEVPQCWGHDDEPQQSSNHDNRIEACPLPIAATQVQPEPELVKRQRESDAVNDRIRLQPSCTWTAKE